MPNSPLRLLLLILAFAFVVGSVQLGVLQIAFYKLGLEPRSAYLLLGASLFGSLINLPLFSVRAESPPDEGMSRQLREFLGLKRLPFTGRTIVAVNVGGCVVPVAFCVYLLAHTELQTARVLAAVAVVAVVSYLTSFPQRGVGIAMPFLVAPATAAAVALVLDIEHAAPLAYVGGTLGVLVGADLLRLKEIGKLGVPAASIGGAGTFDGIVLTGLLAVLLA
ncbi:DUF1614 domain-containing protein [Thauera sinica]|uniref:DUF1614 domain-containing protein n=1 Tax=Thauera sinica TaxID=2665146 RepID=A0ABW1APG0_9RHOO|nr:DUF1614 domain-containing protein [Thauera sp. K11]